MNPAHCLVPPPKLSLNITLEFPPFLIARSDPWTLSLLVRLHNRSLSFEAFLLAICHRIERKLENSFKNVLPDFKLFVFIHVKVLEILLSVLKKKSESGKKGGVLRFLELSFKVILDNNKRENKMDFEQVTLLWKQILVWVSQKEALAFAVADFVKSVCNQSIEKQNMQLLGLFEAVISQNPYGDFYFFKFLLF